MTNACGIGRNFYIYVGKCGDGRYWFIKSSYIYVVVNKCARIFCKITDVVKSKTLWNTLPNEVRSILAKLGVKPVAQHISTQRKGLDLSWLSVDDVEFIENVFALLRKFANLLDVKLCSKCRLTLGNAWRKLVDKYLGMFEPSYVSSFNTFEDVLTEVECILGLKKCM